VRPALFVAAVAAIAAVVPFDALRSVLATAASALLEATPFLLAGRALARWAASRPEAIAYLGCGCGSGPSARSIPAAVATWLVFGPAVAIARFAAAIAISRLVLAHKQTATLCAHRSSFLDDLASMLGPSLLAGFAAQALPFVDLAHASPIAAGAAGAVLGFAAAPCAMGSVAIAGALQSRAPFAAVTFLCVAGLFDARTAFSRERRESGDDALAYVLACAALGIVALRNGDALVHPLIALPLGACAVAMIAFFARHRLDRNARVRFAPALMLAAALVTAPPPSYRATETTLSGAFPGERVNFLGVLIRDGSHDALVRYAIVCCRADATPVVLRVASRLPFAPGAWVHADGTIVAAGPTLLLAPATFAAAAPPADPFVYR
jgi:hypothetical protein